MGWTAPPVHRPDEPQLGDERSMVVGRLWRNRTTLLHKCTGLTGEQLAVRSVPPSDLSLLGLVRHVTAMERNWFRREFLGLDVPSVYSHRGADFDDPDPARAEHDFAALTAEWAACDRAVEGAALDDTFTHQRWGVMSLRWVYGHVTEEYARHCGHADLLRECVDGVTGG